MPTTLRDNRLVREFAWAFSVMEGQTRERFSAVGLLALTPERSFRLLSFAESFSIGRSKYRFLERYRVMENAYIELVFEDLSKEFFTEPRRSLEMALSRINTEKEQIVHLAGQAPVVSSFEGILKTIDGMSDNRFAQIVLRKFKNEASEIKNTTGSHVKGALLVYYIRCAIVHAGAVDLRYEAFDDADDVLASIDQHMFDIAWWLSGLEAIALDAIG